MLMKTATVRFAQLAVVALASLAASPRATAQTALAQTAPAWASAHSTRDYLAGNMRHVLDAEGNVYEVGLFSVAANVGKTYLTSRGCYDGYLGKYNADGTVAWVRQFGSAGEDGAADVAFDAVGNAYVTGTFTQSIDLGNGLVLQGGSAPSRKVFLVKYDPAGIPLWAQQNDTYPGTRLPICPPAATSLGVQVDGAGHVNVTCCYDYATDFGFGGLQPATPNPATARNLSVTKVYMARFSAATGRPQALFPVLYATPANGSGLIFPQRLLTPPGGGTYLVTTYITAPSFTTGLSLAAPASPDVLVAKYSAAGQVEWARTFGGPDRDEATGAATDAVGNLYVTGTYRQSLRFGTATLPGAGAEDGYLVKYSPDGQPQWAKALAGPSADFLRGLCVDPAGNAYVTGSAGPNAHLGSTALAPMGQRDVVVAAYSPQGELSWLQQAGGPDDDEGFALGFTAPGRLRVFGYTGRSAAFDALRVSNAYAWTGFVADLTASPQAATAVAAPALEAARLEPFPNPATSEVHLSGVPVGTRVHVLDALGRVVRETVLTAAAVVSVHGLPPGFYMLRVTDAQGRPVVGRVTVD